MSTLTTLRKYIFLLEKIKEKKRIDAYDSELLEYTKLSAKQLGRLLDDLADEFDSIKKIKDGKKYVYKLIKASDLFVETFKSFGNIGWFFEMAKDGDMEIFKALENYTNENENIYRFINSPFEDINIFRTKEIFAKLENAVKNREYRKIKFRDSHEIYDNLKCLKLIFVDNNWYLAFVDSDNSLKLGRVVFIDSVEYASNYAKFQQSSVQTHLDFIDQIQNSMTLFGVEKRRAIIKADATVARYFEDGMKRFLKSQRFISKQADGTVLFSLDYTQPIEILPFIQRWLPSLQIIEPIELKEYLEKKIGFKQQDN